MNLPGIGNNPNRNPVDNNRPTRVTRTGRQTAINEGTTPASESGQSNKVDREPPEAFVERRTSPDRRKQNNKPLVDTRRNGDRRRSAQVDVIV